MNKIINNQYLKYLWKHNLALIVLYSIILFVILTLFGFSLQIQINDGKAVIFFIRIVSSLIGMGISAIAPIYFMHHLYKKSSIDMYYALPCKKGNFWLEQIIFQYLVVSLPLLMVNMITYFTLMMGGVHIEIYELLWLLILLLFMLVQQSISTLVCIKCNNFLDAMISCVAYYILPIVLFAVIMVFLNTHINQAMLGYGYQGEELFFYSSLIYMISPLVNLITTSFSVYDLPYEAIISDMIWIVIAIMIMIYAHHSYIKKQGEDSEGISKSFVIYPLMIFLIVFMMILNISIIEDQFVFMVITALSIISFVLLVFFANRKIAIKPTYLLAFAIIYLSTIGFSKLFDATHCFNQISEIPMVNHDAIDVASMEITCNDDYQIFKYIKNTKSDELILIQDIHQQSLMILEEKPFKKEWVYPSSNVVIRYIMDDGMLYVRTYILDDNDAKMLLDYALKQLRNK